MKQLTIRLEDLAQYIAKAVAKEQNRVQGHRMTGKLEKSTEGKVVAIPDGLVLDIVREKYGEIIDRGVNRRRIPFSPGSGAKTSKYIEGLIRFVRLRGLRPKPGQTQKDIAFAIAHKHKKVGLPTPGSRRFSQTGRRTGALNEVYDKEKSYIRNEITEQVFQYLEDLIEDILTQLLTSEFSRVYKIAA